MQYNWYPMGINRPKDESERTSAWPVLWITGHKTEVKPSQLKPPQRQSQYGTFPKWYVMSQWHIVIVAVVWPLLWVKYM